MTRRKGTLKGPVAYVDGACEPNPGYSGFGAVLLLPEAERPVLFWEYLGWGTNNTAELTAIHAALEAFEKLGLTREPAMVLSDSQYSIKVLQGTWKAKANLEQIMATRLVMSRFTDLRFHWVRGHAGNQWNELADSLAGQAVSSRRSQRFNVHALDTKPAVV